MGIWELHFLKLQVACFTNLKIPSKPWEPLDCGNLNIGTVEPS